MAVKMRNRPQFQRRSPCPAGVAVLPVANHAEEKAGGCQDEDNPGQLFVARAEKYQLIGSVHLVEILRVPIDVAKAQRVVVEADHNQEGAGKQQPALPSAQQLSQLEVGGESYETQKAQGVGEQDQHREKGSGQPVARAPAPDQCCGKEAEADGQVEIHEAGVEGPIRR